MVPRDHYQVIINKLKYSISSLSFIWFHWLPWGVPNDNSSRLLFPLCDNRWNSLSEIEHLSKKVWNIEPYKMQIWSRRLDLILRIKKITFAEHWSELPKYILYTQIQWKTLNKQIIYSNSIRTFVIKRNYPIWLRIHYMRFYQRKASHMECKFKRNQVSVGTREDITYEETNSKNLF